MELKKIFIVIKKNQKGFTLVELIVALAIIALIMGVMSSAFIAATRTFEKGLDQYDLQANIRLASDFIINEVRNASEISLTRPDSPNDYNKIFFINNMISYKPAGSARIDLTPAIIDARRDINFSLTQTGSQYMLEITIEAVQDENDYSITTQVLLNNVKDAQPQNNKHVLFYR